MSGLRLAGQLTGLAGFLVFVTGFVIGVIQPTPACPPPRGLLCQAEGVERALVMTMVLWGVGLALVIAAVSMLFVVTKRREPRAEQDGPADAVDADEASDAPPPKSTPSTAPPGAARSAPGAPAPPGNTPAAPGNAPAPRQGAPAPRAPGTGQPRPAHPGARPVPTGGLRKRERVAAKGKGRRR